MADNRRCPDHPPLLPLSRRSSAGDGTFSSLSRSLRCSRSSPPESFLPSPSLPPPKKKKTKETVVRSLARGLLSGGKLLRPTSFFRNSRSIDYRGLRDRAGPKWYAVLTVGLARVSQKMELEDMKKRQIGKCPAEEVGEEGGGGKEISRRRKAVWKVMDALSCHEFSGVAVAVYPSVSISSVPPHPL